MPHGFSYVSGHKTNRKWVTQAIGVWERLGRAAPCKRGRARSNMTGSEARWSGGVVRFPPLVNGKNQGSRAWERLQKDKITFAVGTGKQCCLEYGQAGDSPHRGYPTRAREEERCRGRRRGILQGIAWQWIGLCLQNTPYWIGIERNGRKRKPEGLGRELKQGKTWRAPY